MGVLPEGVAARLVPVPDLRIDHWLDPQTGQVFSCSREVIDAEIAATDAAPADDDDGEAVKPTHSIDGEPVVAVEASNGRKMYFKIVDGKKAGVAKSAGKEIVPLCATLADGEATEPVQPDEPKPIMPQGVD